MPKRNVVILIIVFMALCCIPGCKKKLFDHRNKYLGDWEFEYKVLLKKTTFPLLGTGPQTVTTTNFDGKYNGKVGYTYDLNLVNRTISKGDGIEIYCYPESIHQDNLIGCNVDKKGNLTNLDQFQVSGSFSNKNNVSFTASFTPHWDNLSGKSEFTFTITGHR